MELVFPAQLQTILPDVPAYGLYRFRWRVPAVEVFVFFCAAFTPTYAKPVGSLPGQGLEVDEVMKRHVKSWQSYGAVFALVFIVGIPGI